MTDMLRKMTPQVSVLLAVRDGMPYLPDAVQSVWEQTLADIEMIAIDDGSTDGSGDWLCRQTEPRLSVLRTRPRGLAHALNLAAVRARAPLLARLDADDIADPARLERQARYMADHPGVGLLGTGAYEYGPRIEGYLKVTPPESDAELRRELGRRNPLVHSSVMFRRQTWAEAGGYDESFTVAQDYDLWLRMSRWGRLACLPDPLVIRRRHGASVTSRRPWARRWAQCRARFRAVRRGQYPVTILIPRMA